MKDQAESGNGFLEILLFLPIAVLLLFSAIDCGLSFRERGALRDAIRAGLHGHALALRDSRLPTGALQIGTPLAESDGGERQVAMLKSVVAEIGQLISAALPASGGDNQDLAIEGRVVSMQIDASSGKWRGFTFGSEPSRFPENNDFSLSDHFSGVVPLSTEQFMDELFKKEGEQVPSSYALPSSWTGGSRDQFLGTTPALLVKVSAAARGLPLSPFGRMFSNISAIEEFSLIPLRTPLG